MPEDYPKYFIKRGKRYCIYYEKVIEGQRFRARFSLGTSDLGEALALYKKKIHQVIAEAHSPTKTEKLSLNSKISAQQVFDWHLSRITGGHSSRTIARYQNHFNILKAFMPQKVLKNVRFLTLDHCERWKKARMASPIGRGKDKCPSKRTINNDIRAFSQFWKSAQRHCHDLSNPWLELDRFRGAEGRGEKEKTELIGDEIGHFLKEAMQTDPELHNIFFLYFKTGLRRSELLFLEWEDVDLENRVLYVRRKKTITQKFQESVGPETRKILRDIGGKFNSIEQARELMPRLRLPVRNPRDLMSISLKNFQDDFKSFQFERELENKTKKFKERKVPLSTKTAQFLTSIRREKGLVFPTAIRRRLDLYFKKFTKAIGRPDVTELHSTRRSFAVTCRMRGVPLHTVQEILGHDDINLTLKIYAKYQANEGHSHIEKID